MNMVDSPILDGGPSQKIIDLLIIALPLAFEPQPGMPFNWGVWHYLATI
jgi:hypothetical protein